MPVLIAGAVVPLATFARSLSGELHRRSRHCGQLKLNDLVSSLRPVVNPLKLVEPTRNR